MAEKIAKAIEILANVLVGMSHNDHRQFREVVEAIDILNKVVEEYLVAND